MPKVLNIRDSDKGIFIGRPSKWGNPFVIGKDGTRAEVLRKYRIWLLTQAQLKADAKKELQGKDLVCFCSPKPCHGDILMQIANASEKGKLWQK